MEGNLKHPEKNKNCKKPIVKFFLSGIQKKEKGGEGQGDEGARRAEGDGGGPGAVQSTNRVFEISLKPDRAL